MVKDPGVSSGHTSNTLANKVGSLLPGGTLDTARAESCLLAVTDKVIQRME